MRHDRPRHAVVRAAATAVAALSLSACGATSGPETRAPLYVTTPLATSISTTGGQWAVIPMGHLKQPLNTFWQLLYRPTGSLRWVDKVVATAVGTNGGIVLASSNGQSIVAAVRPSNFLTFSPLLSSTNSGESWSNGVVTPGLASHPNSLATSSGRSVALVQVRGQSVVYGSDGQLSTWTTIATQNSLRTLASSVSCDLTDLTAVAVVRGVDYAGGVCQGGDRAALFSDIGGRWGAVPTPSVPGPASAFSEILALDAVDGGVGLLRVDGSGTTRSLRAMWRSASGHWTQTPSMTLPEGSIVTSTGEQDGRFFAVVDGPAGGQLLTASAASRQWRVLSPIPEDTQTVVFGPTSLIQALVVQTSTLSVWSLVSTSASGVWTEGQVLHVPIPYGSAG